MFDIIQMADEDVGQDEVVGQDEDEGAEARSERVILLFSCFASYYELSCSRMTVSVKVSKFIPQLAYPP